MASTLIVLLSLALLGCAYSAPTTAEQPAETTTAADQGDEDVSVLTVLEVVDPVPAIVEIVDVPTTPEPETTEPIHKVAKRSALRGDNPSNDLLANYDGLLFDNGQAGLDGRRIKFLPTWVG
ncbi:hypothetical protein B5X24_HaOG212093 [Helicoverpa armigera]|uniref:Secreted protein n=1 Tax=Helicoverpa armigera TaxID=29058 RepID=A0A2W1BGL6_HELAM|nr:hypothetical protein B5X24_HaOG212093 [Helicoverpa armigera]